MCTEALQTKPLELAILVQWSLSDPNWFSVIVFYFSLLYSPSINNGERASNIQTLLTNVPFFQTALSSSSVSTQVHYNYHHEEQSCDSPSMPPQSSSLKPSPTTFTEMVSMLARKISQRDKMAWIGRSQDQVWIKYLLPIMSVLGQEIDEFL